MKLTFAVEMALALGILALPAAASSITTSFASNNRFTGNMFDLTTGANALTLDGFSVNVDPGPMTIDVYVKTGTFVGSETNSAAWTLISATSVTGLGQNKPTSFSIAPYSLSASTLYGVYVTVDTNINAAPFMYYTNGNSVASNSDLSLALGDGIGGKFGSLSVISARSWDGTIDYTLKSLTTTPEPTTFLLLTVALPGVLFLRRRRA